MPYATAGLNAGVNGIASAGTRVSFHTADPGTTGAAEIAGTGRPATTWGAASAGVRAGSQVSAPIPATTTVTHWGLWTAATGGSFLYGDSLRNTGGTASPETFGGAGTIQHTPTLTVTNVTETPPVEAFVWPDASNVGYLGSMGSLTAMSGGTVSTPGTIIENRHITGDMWITAANVTFRNCYIEGGAFGVDTASTAHNLTIEDCTLDGGPQCGAALNGNGGIIRRCNIFGGQDGIKPGGDNVLIHRNYIHDLVPAGADPHHDGMQFGSGQNVTITENHVVSKDTSCIAMFQGQGTWGNVLVQKNKLLGPVSYTFYSPGTSRTAGTFVRVLDNVIDGWGFGPVTDWIPTGNEWSGNVNLAGSPVLPT